MRLIISIIITTIFISCGSEPEYSNLISSHISESGSHKGWDGMLKKHVDDKGWVNYKTFLADSAKLNIYLDELSQNPPSVNWSEKEKLAYWINAYNAFTVNVIIDNYPLKSITDIKKFHIPLVNTVWHDQFIKIGEQTISLNYIEHEILRKKFDEPRIHFAINCASVSCPELRNEAYSSEKIELQLKEQTFKFFNDSTKNYFSKDKIQISRIFQWFKKDFTKESDLISYLNRYSHVKINADASVSYKKYDWNLNLQQQ